MQVLKERQKGSSVVHWSSWRGKYRGFIWRKPLPGSVLELAPAATPVERPGTQGRPLGSRTCRRRAGQTLGKTSVSISPRPCSFSSFLQAWMQLAFSVTTLVPRATRNNSILTGRGTGAQEFFSSSGPGLPSTITPPGGRIYRKAMLCGHKPSDPGSD